MNTVSLIGALTKDPELRLLPGTDKPVLDVRLAVRRPKAAADGTRADYFTVTLFGRQAEIVADYSAKGRRIGITGHLKLDEWGHGKDRKSRVVIIAEDLTVIDWPPRTDAETADAVEQDEAASAPIAA